MAFLTDPRIPLQSQTPNLADVYMRAQAIKGSQQEQQLRSLSLAQAVRADQTDQDIDAAYRTGDPVSALKLSNPRAASELQAKLDQQAAAKAKADAEQRKLDLENGQKKIEYVGHVLGSANEHNYPLLRNGLIGQGIAKPEELPEQYDPAAIKQVLDQTLTYKDKIQQELDQTKAAEVGRHNVQTETNTAAERAETKRYHDAEIKNQNRNTNLRAAEFQLQKDKQNTDNDASIETQAQQIAKYDLPAPPQSRMNPRNAAVWKRALEINPNLSTAGYTTKQNFKTKGDSQQIESLSTALEHLGNAQANSKEVGFAPFLGTNATAADARYNKDIQLYTEEVGKLIKNGVVTKEELHDLQSGLNSSRRGIRDAALGELTNLLGGKVKAKFQKYKTGTGLELDPKEFFDQATQDRLSKNGIIGGQEGGTAGKFTVTAPDGSKHDFANQEQADTFKKLAGIK